MKIKAFESGRLSCPASKPSNTVNKVHSISPTFSLVYGRLILEQKDEKVSFAAVTAYLIMQRE